MVPPATYSSSGALPPLHWQPAAHKYLRACLQTVGIPCAFTQLLSFCVDLSQAWGCVITQPHVPDSCILFSSTVPHHSARVSYEVTEVVNFLKTEIAA